MVDNSTWAGMKAMDLRMDIFCSHCERMVEIDIDKMPPEGKALGRRWPCSKCGRDGQVTISHRSATRSVPGLRGKVWG
jgi:hypothetical protein